MQSPPLLALATDEFRRRLEGVDPALHDRPSSCDGWTVRQLVGHVIAGNRMAVAILHGASAEEAVAELMAAADPGPDLLGAFDAAAGAQLDAFGEPGALERNCHHPMGDLPGAVVLDFRVSDLTVHGWDLARSTGGDEVLAPELVAAVWASTEPMADMMTASGMFGDGRSGALSPDAPVQDRLLDAMGRRP